MRAYVDSQHPAGHKLEVWEHDGPIPKGAWVRDLNAHPTPHPIEAPPAKPSRAKAEPEADEVPLERFTFADPTAQGVYAEIQWPADWDTSKLVGFFMDFRSALYAHHEAIVRYEPGTPVRVGDRKHRLKGHTGTIRDRLGSGTFTVMLDSPKGEVVQFAASQLVITGKKPKGRP